MDFSDSLAATKKERDRAAVNDGRNSGSGGSSDFLVVRAAAAATLGAGSARRWLVFLFLLFRLAHLLLGALAHELERAALRIEHIAAPVTEKKKVSQCVSDTHAGSERHWRTR